MYLVAIPLILISLFLSSSILSNEQNYFLVESPKGLETDIKLIKESLNKDIPNLLKFFGKDKSLLLKSIPYRIILQDKVSNDVYEGQAMLSSGTQDGTLNTYYAYLRVLALSKYDSSGTTLTNDPHDSNFFRKLMVHEYSTVVADVLMRNKEKGAWRYFNSPSWFVEGFVEYLAFNFSGGDNKKRFFKLKKRAKGKIEYLENPYVFGPLFIDFLIGKFGKETLLSFIYSNQKSFQQAFITHYKVSHHRLINLFKQNFKKPGF